jgi:hypothetical protein
MADSETPTALLQSQGRYVSIHGVGDANVARNTMSGASIYSMNIQNMLTNGFSPCTMSSSDVNDTALGAGARTVEITGLGADGRATKATYSLNGTSSVSIGSWMFINDARIITTGGTVATSIGNITILHNSNQIATINAGTFRSSTAVYRVPAQETLRLQSLYIQSHANTYNHNARCELNVWTPSNQRRIRLQEWTPQLTPQELTIEEVFPSLSVVEFTGFKYGDLAITFGVTARGYLLSGSELR